MSAGAAELVTRARVLSNLTRNQLALLADVSPSTVTRVESGNLDPTYGMLSALLAACGYSTGQSLTPRADLDSLRAGRLLLDSTAHIAWTEGALEWVRRWERIGLVRDGRAVDLDGVAFRAANTARLAARPGARRFSMPDGGWQEAALMLRDSGVGWAMTGGYAALRYTSIANAVWPVFYVEDVDDVAPRAGFAPAEQPGVGVTLVPFDDVTRVGVNEFRGVRWVAPWQIALDCYSGTGRMPDQAEDMIGNLAGRSPG